MVELTDPTYDPATGKATYEVKVLADEMAVDLNLEQQPITAADATLEFGAASLFIDDCPDGTLQCETPFGDFVGSITLGYCWHSDNWCCDACNPQDWAAVCNQAFSDCNGTCHFERSAWFKCN